MPKKARELKALEVARLTSTRLVGGVPGLMLNIDGASRSWLLRLSISRRVREMGLGPYPEVSLATAREKAAAARELARGGIDPIQAAHAARSAELARRAASKTFREVAEACIASRAHEWKNLKHRDQWSATLATYAYPVLGDLLVADIGPAHVKQVLEPIWASKTETATRVRGRVESVLGYAIALGYRSAPNPAAWKDGLKAVLPNPRRIAKRGHHEALPYAQVPAFTKRLRDADGQAARALEFAILTAGRSGEVRGAAWSEVDVDERVWNVPAVRMKGRREHRVPLSPAAVALLKRQQRVEGSDLVFPSAHGGALSDMALTAVLRRMQVNATPHGFRSSFRTWAAEQTLFPREVAEAALAHAIESDTEAAYQRGDLLDKRRRLMEQWSAYCAFPAATATVTALPAATATVTTIRKRRA